jgi:hypothetical protein
MQGVRCRDLGLGKVILPSELGTHKTVTASF